MVRNFIKTGIFNMVAAAVCLSPLTGLSKPAQAQALPQPPAYSQFVNTYIMSCSWAGAGRVMAMTVNMRGQNLAGSVDGYINFFGATGWTAQGSFLSQTGYVDQSGEHIEVKAAVNFSAPYAVSATPATATFRALKTPTGAASEGVEIVDQSGKVLYSTGRDAANNLILLPLMKGSLYISH